MQSGTFKEQRVLRFLTASMLFLAITVIGIQSNAQPQRACEARPTVSLQNDFGPVLDKGPVGWCYAYSAADLIEQWLRNRFRSQYGSIRLSAPAIAITYYRETRQQEVAELATRIDQYRMRGAARDRERNRGTQILIALQAARERGDQREVEQLELEFAQSQALTTELTQKQSRLDPERAWTNEAGDTDTAITAAMNSGLCSDRFVSPEVLQPTVEQSQAMSSLGMTQMSIAQLDMAIRRAIATRRTNNLESFRPIITRFFPRYQLTSVESFLREPDPLQSLFEAQCVDVNLQQVGQPQLEKLIIDRRQPERFFSIIRETLERNRPLEISYNSSIFGRPGGHSSTIIGYRRCGSDYEYQIRNNWGPRSCASYRTQIGNSAQFTCDQQGHYWVHEGAIRGVALSVLRIENY